jgi:hypothetical protein
VWIFNCFGESRPIKIRIKDMPKKQRDCLSFEIAEKAIELPERTKLTTFPS